MKVLLINPPQTFYPGSDPPAGNLPLGLMYLAAVLQKNGYTVEILDAFISGADFEEKKGEEVTIGLPFKQIKEEIQARKPNIVGIAGPFTSQIGHAIQTSKVAKEANSHILTVVGGPHVTLVPKEFLEEAHSVDIAVTGEGEFAMLEIVQYLEGKKQLSEIKGIACRQNGSVIVNPRRPFIDNLDELPYPAYDLVDMERDLGPS